MCTKVIRESLDEECAVDSALIVRDILLLVVTRFDRYMAIAAWRLVDDVSLAAIR